MHGDGPGLPRLELRRGARRIEVFDPRPDPLALGPRYIHGCYVADWWEGDRRLTGQPQPDWTAYDGRGLPEVFELGLGFADTPVGEDYLRIGAGRRQRQADDLPFSAGGALGAGVTWELVHQDETRLVMRCADRLGRGRDSVGYALERTLRLTGDGLAITSRLRVECRWSAPLWWFAHPFLAHADGAGTAFALPPGAEVAGGPDPLVRQDDGRWRAAPGGGFATATGLWGATAPCVLHLDARQGGGTVAVQVDRPLDKAVLWASRQVASVEPYWSRAWQRGETAEWTVAYAFAP